MPRWTLLALVFGWTLVLHALAPGGAAAQSLEADPGVTASAPGSPGSPDATVATVAPVAPVAPQRDYLAEARQAFTPLNRSYSRARVWVRIAGPLYGILVGLLLMFSGLAARFRDIANGLGHRRYVRVLVFFTLYSVAVFALSLPLAWYEEFALEHQYGLSTQSFGGWALDSVKGLVFSIVAVGVVPLLATVWWAIEKQQKRWWLWVALGTLPVALASAVLQPLVFEPLFNQFTPLKDASLRGEILALGARAGIPARDVYEVDMSARTRKVNAYVSGFGASQRIVLWDTTLRAMKRDEILFVMGHEMGHYVLAHTWKYLGLISLGAFAGFWLCGVFARAWLAGFGQRWGVTRLDDLAAMPVLLLSLTLVTLLALPGLNAASCAIEHESDVYGLEITRDNDAGARAFLKLAQDNRSDPEPADWVRILLYDHPPLGERIRFAMAYRPWESGAPNRFYRERNTAGLAAPARR